MLKLTYTEAGLHLERLDISLEEFVTNRMLLGLRSGLSIHIESSRAAFLLTADVVDLLLLKVTTQAGDLGRKGFQEILV